MRGLIFGGSTITNRYGEDPRSSLSIRRGEPWQCSSRILAHYFSTTFLGRKTGWITLRNTSSTGCVDRGHPLKGGL